MTKGLPKKILLATDLSARCDRALDRAALLGVEWGAELTAVHALERTNDFYDRELEARLPSWRRKDAVALVEAQLRSDLAHDLARAVVEKGEPEEVILRVAGELSADLIVTGIARDETLGRFSLGATVDRLLRRSTVPLLIVKQRARARYADIVVATDFSAISRHALGTAMELFPDRVLTLFHAYATPMEGMTGDAAGYREQLRAVALKDAQEFLHDSDVPSEPRRRFTFLVEPGDPAVTLNQYVRDRQIDLVILGTHGRNALVDTLLGSTAKAILASLPCDALVVRGP